MAYEERRQNGNGNGGGKLVKVGAMWKPKPGGKSCGSGSVTIKGWKQRFVVLKNTRKERPNEPDWILMSSDQPEADTFRVGGSNSQPARRDEDREEPPAHDDIPF